MNRLTTLALVAMCSLAAKQLPAQQPANPPAKHAAAHAYKRDVPDSLLRHVKITEDSARVVALHHVPGGTIQALELEHENGVLVYSWDIKVPGKAGITEVQINALNGKVVAVEHENH